MCILNANRNGTPHINTKKNAENIFLNWLICYIMWYFLWFRITSHWYRMVSCFKINLVLTLQWYCFQNIWKTQIKCLGIEIFLLRYFNLNYNWNSSTYMYDNHEKKIIHIFYTFHKLYKGRSSRFNVFAHYTL
jgi:hypothetical protein